jgi:hypothetical protein
LVPGHALTKPLAQRLVQARCAAHVHANDDEKFIVLDCVITVGVAYGHFGEVRVSHIRVRGLGNLANASLSRVIAGVTERR